MPALHELARAAMRLMFSGDASQWDRALQMPHYNTRSMPAISLHTGMHLIQARRLLFSKPSLLFLCGGNMTWAAVLTVGLHAEIWPQTTPMSSDAVKCFLYLLLAVCCCCYKREHKQ